MELPICSKARKGGFQVALIHLRSQVLYRVKSERKQFLLDAWAGKIHFESLTTKQRSYVVNYIAFVGKIHTHSKMSGATSQLHSKWIINTCHIKEDIKIWCSKDVFKCYWTRTKLEEEFGSKKGTLEFVYMFTFWW